MRLILILLLLLSPSYSEAKCINGVSYTLKGYFEDLSNNVVTGKALTTTLFDIFYDDGTSSLGNQATAEMGQGWYRLTYTSNAKNGVWIMRDSDSGTAYKNFPGGILEQLCDSQVSNYDSTGAVSINAAGLRATGFLKQITVGTGSTTSTVVSSGLSETHAKAYVGNLIMCDTVAAANNAGVTLKIIGFNPATDTISLAGTFPTALSNSDVCNIYINTVR